jgi:formamidopyrimidine-DNA glycosylase
MPELPEVETTRKGVAPYVLGKIVSDVVVRESRLRWPVPKQLKKYLIGQTIRKIDRRAKYLLFYTEAGCMLLHLGMSGSLRIIDKQTPTEKHDHIDFIFDSNHCLRFRDPRRFGSIHWTKADPNKHKLLRDLGPEPLTDDLNGDYLYQKSRARVQAIKTFIMDSHIVVGVGNIYANEALFAAGILPKRKAGNVSKERYARLSKEIKKVLSKALKKGGTTLRDFVNSDGQPGYFRHELQIYNHAGEPCINCKSLIKTDRLGQRSTFFCTTCQK